MNKKNIINKKENPIFNPEILGPFDYLDFREIENQKKQEELRQATLGEIISIVYFSLDRKNKKQKKIIDIFENKKIVGRTLSLINNQGIFIDDNPYLSYARGDLRRYFSFLKQKLESKNQDGVIYSEDKNIRFASSLLENSEIKDSRLTAILGNQENKEKLKTIAEKYEINLNLENIFNKPENNNELEEDDYKPRYKLVVPCISIKKDKVSISGEKFNSGFYSFFIPK